MFQFHSLYIPIVFVLGEVCPFPAVSNSKVEKLLVKYGYKMPPQKYAQNLTLLIKFSSM